MSWERVLQNDEGNGERLSQRIAALFEQQRATWPALREGETSLQRLQTKTLVEDGEQIVVQVNPARRRSTQAKTDARSVAARPCFLCPDNMPAEERGVAFEDLVILPNPFPILPGHCTIAGRAHRPQKLAGRIDVFLRLAAAIGPELAALYNGPQCGASAPDHLHFQAASAAHIPILSQIAPLAVGHRRDSRSSFGRSMLVLASSIAADIQSDIEQLLAALERLAPSDAEPMINLIARYDAGRYIAVLFPRRAHRPACYFAEGTDRLAVSPAVLEMAGLLVTTSVEDFERVDAATARSIYEQVSLEPATCDQLLADMT